MALQNPPTEKAIASHIERCMKERGPHETAHNPGMMNKLVKNKVGDHNMRTPETSRNARGRHK